MEYNEIKEAVFLTRRNRFIAEVEIEGVKQTVHVKNTGRCRELLLEGVKVYLEDHGEAGTNRKTRYSLIAVEKHGDKAGSEARVVNIDSYAPNRVVGEALADGTILLPGFDTPYVRIKPETAYGASRFDFYVENSRGSKALIEVKGVTLEDGGIVRFPDAPTERGVRHINELCDALEKGFAAYLIFVIQMKDVIRLEPNDETHPAFGEALRKAFRRGVVVQAYDCDVTPGGMKIAEPVTVLV